MDKINDLLERLNDPYRRLVVSDRQEAAEIIKTLVETVRDYNPDDELFDDEKRAEMAQAKRNV